MQLLAPISASRALGMLVGLALALAVAGARQQQRPASGAATIISSECPASVSIALLGELGMPAPLARASGPKTSVGMMGVVANASGVPAPMASVNVKRIFLQNKCRCSLEGEAYPLVALSYVPVQSSEFYTVGYWPLDTCAKTYVVATTNTVVYMSADMTDNSVTWRGPKRLTPYLPTENKCAAARGFKEYKLPANWNDHTINLTC